MRSQSLLKIGVFCENQKETEMVKAQLGLRLQDYDFSKTEHKALLSMLFTEWAFMIGTKEANTPQENLINAKFTINEYKDITLQEIEQAMKWSITGKLSIDPTCYGKFAPMYIAKILNCYLNERDTVMAFLRRRWRLQIWRQEWEEKNKELPYEERVASHREFLIRALTDMKVKGAGDTAGQLCWKFLERALQVDESQFTEEVDNYATEKIKAFQLRDDYHFYIKNLSRVEIQQKLEREKVGYMKTYVIHQWLKNVDSVEDFVSKQHEKIIVEA